MEKVYIVTQGCYSDYSIVGVFTTEEEADRATKILRIDKDSDVSVEEWPLNVTKQIPDGFFLWEVPMKKDGDLFHRVTKVYELSHIADLFYEHHDMCNFRVIAKDEIHAIKIANERRAALIMLGKWPRYNNMGDKM